MGRRQHLTHRYGEGARIPRCLRTQARTYALHRDLGGLHAIPLPWRDRRGKGAARLAAVLAGESPAGAILSLAP